MFDWQVSITAREDVPPFGPPLPSPPIFTEVRTHNGLFTYIIAINYNLVSNKQWCDIFPGSSAFVCRCHLVCFYWSDIHTYLSVAYWSVTDDALDFDFQGSVLREFLLTKLINAEISCYKAERFSRLEVTSHKITLKPILIFVSHSHTYSCVFLALYHFSYAHVHLSWKHCGLNYLPALSACWESRHSPASHSLKEGGVSQRPVGDSLKTLR